MGRLSITTGPPATADPGRLISSASAVTSNAYRRLIRNTLEYIIPRFPRRSSALRSGRPPEREGGRHHVGNSAGKLTLLVPRGKTQNRRRAAGLNVSGDLVDDRRRWPVGQPAFDVLAGHGRAVVGLEEFHRFLEGGAPVVVDVDHEVQRRLHGF